MVPPVYFKFIIQPYQQQAPRTKIASKKMETEVPKGELSSIPLKKSKPKFAL
jgi:hypothetical protein